MDWIAQATQPIVVEAQRSTTDILLILGGVGTLIGIIVGGIIQIMRVSREGAASKATITEQGKQIDRQANLLDDIQQKMPSPTQQGAWYPPSTPPNP